MDTGNVIVKTHIDSSNLIIDTVINSPIYYKVTGIAKELPQLWKDKDTTVLNSYLLTKFEENINNPFSLMLGNYYAILNQNSRTDLLKLKALTDKQGKRFNWFLAYPMVVDRLNKILTVSKTIYQNFTVINRKNKTTKLQLQNSNYYVLDFWFLGCAPCMREHKTILENYEKLRKKKIEVIGISNNEDFQEWKSYLTKHRYDWQNYMQINKNNLNIQLGIYEFPTYIVIDNNGKIIETYNSFDDVIKKFIIN